MKKKKTKKQLEDTDMDPNQDLLEQEDSGSGLQIDPVKIIGITLFLFAFFSFFSLFDQAGSFGRAYFSFLTEALGIYAYLTPMLYLFVAYTIIFKKTKVYMNLHFWLFTILLFTLFLGLGFFQMSGKLGNLTTSVLQDSFGTIPTSFMLVIVSLFTLSRIFEMDLLSMFYGDKQQDDYPTLTTQANEKVLGQQAETTDTKDSNLTDKFETGEPKESFRKTDSMFTRLFGSMFGLGKNDPKTLPVNHLNDLQNQNSEYEEYEEVEEEVDAPEDYRSAMYKAVSVDMSKEEKEKIKVRKLVKKAIAAKEMSPVVAKENAEKLRQVNEKYSHPPISLYTEDSGRASAGDNKENARIIKRTLADFGISVEMDEVTVGPTVTRYALKPAQGVKIEKIMNLSNNIALELGVASVSITRVHERSLIGIEVPNKQKANLGIGSLLNKKDFLERKDKLTMALGKDIYGDPVFADMTKMPHLLIAGTTGSGKSSLMHALINSLIFKNSPYDLKFILIDPKKVEFALYNNLPHLYTPVIKDPKKAVQTLNWLVQEMDRRYALLEDCGKQNITGYHAFVMEKYKKIESRGSDTTEKLPDKMPYIILVIDELADFMMKYPKEMESGIVKLAQMSRAVGIHLILATQRPSTNIITGVIKGNIPSRVALRVASQVDSRVIIDQGGAEKLLGYGDLLFVNADGSDMKRIQSPFVREEEIKDVVAYLREEYDDLVAEELKTPDGNIVGAQNISNGSNGSAISDADFASEDDKYEQAKEVVMQTKKTSVSNLQVRLGTGYARSAKLINMLEQAGVIITVTDNSGKKVKAVAGDSNNPNTNQQEENISNTREDILKVEDDTEQPETQEKESSGFFRF